MTHSIQAPHQVLMEKGPQIWEAKAGGELRAVKPFTFEVRAEIDNELVAKSFDFMKRQTDAGKPFFLYLPFSPPTTKSTSATARNTKRFVMHARRRPAWTRMKTSSEALTHRARAAFR
jgi:hypothetical protein